MPFLLLPTLLTSIKTCMAPGGTRFGNFIIAACLMVDI
jgi:hypothetical protein